jgi:ATP-dependent Clp protease adaptor protein ClpS
MYFELPEDLDLWDLVNAQTAAPERTTTILPDLEDLDTRQSQQEGYIVIVYDNDVNTWDEVVMILQKATGCSLEEAEIETWEVDNLGKSVVHHGSREECERAAGIIRTIGIRVEVVEE